MHTERNKQQQKRADGKKQLKVKKNITRNQSKIESYVKKLDRGIIRSHAKDAP